MTKKEWNKARECSNNYVLFIVSNLDFEPKFNRYNNPHKLFKSSVETVPTLTITWHIKKKDLEINLSV